jgi:hypothetical protein
MAALVREFVLKPGPRTADVEPRIKCVGSLLDRTEGADARSVSQADHKALPQG